MAADLFMGLWSKWGSTGRLQMEVALDSLGYAAALSRRSDQHPTGPRLA